MADITVTAANVKLISNSRTKTVQFGETITAGQSLYLKAADGKYWRGDADALDTAAFTGIALSNGGANSYGSMADKADTEIDIGGTVTVGQIYVVSVNSGGIAPYSDLATGDYVSVIGVGKTTTNILLYPAASGVVKP